MQQDNKNSESVQLRHTTTISPIPEESDLHIPSDECTQSGNIQTNQGIDMNNSDTDSYKVEEIGGPQGLEPTRYGDWLVNGRCSDF